MTVSDDAVVTISYTLTDDDGTVLDSSANHGDLSYLHGHGNIITGLEAALSGREVGDEIKATVEAADAYGERNDEKVVTVPRAQFPEDAELSVGMEFVAQTNDGQQIPVTVVTFSDTDVTLDSNHPLAGQRLHFDVTIRGIRDATSEEIDHGHVHDGSHDHEH